MMNSRTRSSPPRGRGSSLSFTEKWYQSCGSSRYERISRAWNVNVSSWVKRQEELPSGPIGHVEESRESVAPRRLPQLDRRQQWAEELLRADRVHLLADDLLHLSVDPPAERQVRPEPGADLSDEPAPDEELVADRLSIRRVLAQGGQEELRCPGCQRLLPSSSLAWISDASAIASAAGFAIFRRFGTVRPFADPLVDLVEQLVDQDVRGDLLQHAAVGIHEADVASARDPEVGVAGLPRPVHGAAENGDLEVLRVPRTDAPRPSLRASARRRCPGRRTGTRS